MFGVPYVIRNGFMVEFYVNRGGREGLSYYTLGNIN